MTRSDGTVRADDDPIAVDGDGPAEAVDREPTPQEWGPGSSVGRPDDDGSSPARSRPAADVDSDEDEDDDREAAPYADGSQAV